MSVYITTDQAFVKSSIKVSNDKINLKSAMTKSIYLKQCKKDDHAVMYVPMMTAHIKSTTFTNICLQEIASNLRNQLQKNEAAKNNKRIS